MSFFTGIRKKIRGIIPMVKDKSVPWWKKAVFVIGVIYLLLPVDLIPPLVPVFGWLDDILLWIAILYFLGPELEKYAEDGPEPKRNKKYRYKDEDVHEVDFTVVEESDEEASETDAEDIAAKYETETVKEEESNGC